MNINQLASKIAKKEGKKSQVKIGDIREILGIFADMLNENPVDVLYLLLAYAEKRKKKGAANDSHSKTQTT